MPGSVTVCLVQVLGEFAHKIAAQYILKKQESRAQQVALELELELLQEEEERYFLINLSQLI